MATGVQPDCRSAKGDALASAKVTSTTTRAEIIITVGSKEKSKRTAAVTVEKNEQMCQVCSEYFIVLAKKCRRYTYTHNYYIYCKRACAKHVTVISSPAQWRSEGCFRDL